MPLQLDMSAMREVWLPYGRTKVRIEVPEGNFLGFLEPREVPGVPSPRDEVLRALSEPIGTDRISDIVGPGDKVVITAEDHTRSAPSWLMIPPILDELNSAGVKDENITILFACGTHRAVRPEEAEKLLGPEVLRRVRVLSHDCEAPGHVYIGDTSFGNRVEVNRVFAEADVRILTGDVGLHYYAGYGGGRKSVLPGVSSASTIQFNHAMLLHPNAKMGVLEGNPVHEDMMEAAKLADVDFILNVVENAHHELVKAFAGDLEKAFMEGVKLVDKIYKVPLKEKADVVVVSSGGHPHDIDLYQAYKGIHTALEAVKDGGVIVAIAECPEGHGHKVFYEWMTRYKTLEEMEERIKANFVLGGHKAYYIMKALEKAHIILVSSMPSDQVRDIFRLEPARTAQEGLEKALKLAGRDAGVLVMTHGNITLPTPA
ncbi:MAG TPA: nickel-dependent lactate racemase [Candidatus Bathyarchaeota archaeon]|nr:nickel-dependent lactate racemase [Candidatus Bathyarchaeota archaeon]